MHPHPYPHAHETSIATYLMFAETRFVFPAGAKRKHAAHACKRRGTRCQSTKQRPHSAPTALGGRPSPVVEPSGPSRSDGCRVLADRTVPMAARGARRTILSACMRHVRRYYRGPVGRSTFTRMCVRTCTRTYTQHFSSDQAHTHNIFRAISDILSEDRTVA